MYYQRPYLDLEFHWVNCGNGSSLCGHWVYVKISLLSQLPVRFPQSEEVRCGCDYTGQGDDCV